MTKPVSMFYIFNRENDDLDECYQKIKLLKETCDLVRQYYGGSGVRIEAYLSILKGFINEHYGLDFEISGTTLEKPFASFINKAGIPDFINQGSDYSMIERILRSHGKTLKRKIYTFTEGKHVIDIPAKKLSLADIMKAEKHSL